MFTGARPLMMTPPQSPRARLPTGWSLVNTIGASRVPIAFSRPPRSTISVPTLPASPMTRRAGGDVEGAAVADEHGAAQDVVAAAGPRSVPVTSPVTTITGLSMPGTFTGDA